MHSFDIDYYPGSRPVPNEVLRRTSSEFSRSTESTGRLVCDSYLGVSGITPSDQCPIYLGACTRMQSQPSLSAKSSSATLIRPVVHVTYAIAFSYVASKMPP